MIKFFGLGSIVEMGPLLRSVRQHFPQGRLVFLTFDCNETLLRRLNVCTHLRTIRTSSPIRFAFDVFCTIIWFRMHNVEAVVDLEFFSKFSTLMSFLTGAHIRIGYHLNEFWRYSLLTHPIYFNYFHHIADVYAQAGRQLGVEVRDRSLIRIIPHGNASAAVRRWLHSRGWSGATPILGVNVNASDLSHERRWPIERFAIVVGELLNRHEDLSVVLTGSVCERHYTAGMLNHLSPSLRDRVLVAAGDWSLDEFIAAMELLDCMVTNDSGPMHIAAAMQTPLVSLWGPSRPDFLAPQVDNHRVIHEGFPCNPCMLMFTTFEGMWCNREGWCMRAIQPEIVINAVEATLAETRRRRSPASDRPEAIGAGAIQYV
ncbi:MAG: glycosyltransferase family 9 protein [Planctomycetes bacterium]|nr:glycosyltransferase family 9 protein [Planctomycetota bacterium]